MPLAASQEHPPKRLMTEVRNWVRDIVFASLTAVLIVVFVVQPVKVEGTSMEPRLFDDERIFVNKFVYHFSEISRGDIVVFWYPKDTSKSFIKRVIGLPGERVEVRDGVVFVDDQVIDEPYVPSDYIDPLTSDAITIPEGCYYVMGDHRNSSNDSRNWGTVPSEYIFGKAMLRYWPLSKFGMIQ